MSPSVAMRAAALTGLGTFLLALPLTVLATFVLAWSAVLLVGASASQPLVSFVYGMTDWLVRPVQAIFGRPDGPPTVDAPAVLAALALLLFGALGVAGVRAATGDPNPTG